MRRRTRRVRQLLGLAAAGCVVLAVLASPALAASPSAVDNTAADAGVDNTVDQSTPAANVPQPATPAPSPAAEPAPATPEPAAAGDAPDVATPDPTIPTAPNGSVPEPKEPSVGDGGVSETIDGPDNTVSARIGGTAEAPSNALPGSAGKEASGPTDTVGKASNVALAKVGEALGGLAVLTPRPDLGGLLGGAGRLIKRLSVPAPPEVPAVSGLAGQSGDQTPGSHALTDATGKAARGPNSLRSALLSVALTTPSMSSTPIPSVEPAGPSGSSPDHGPLPRPGGTSGPVAAASNGLLLFGFAAMLLVALAAAAPVIRRVIQIAPAGWRSAPFVALLERPG